MKVKKQMGQQLRMQLKAYLLDGHGDTLCLQFVKDMEQVILRTDSVNAGRKGAEARSGCMPVADFLNANLPEDETEIIVIDGFSNEAERSRWLNNSSVYQTLTYMESLRQKLDARFQLLEKLPPDVAAKVMILETHLEKVLALTLGKDLDKPVDEAQLEYVEQVPA